MQENVEHSYKNGRYDNKTYQLIYVTYYNGREETYPSITKASQFLGVHRDTIYGFLERGYSPLLEQKGIKEISRNTP